MRFIVTTDSVINHLEFFGSVDGQTGHIFDASTYGFYVRMFVFLEPGAFADAVMSYLDFSGLVILYRRSFKLR